MSSRLDQNNYFMDMAKLVANRSTCVRRSVGCVIVNKYGHVMSTGYNGVPKGMGHCTDTPCAGAHLKSGEGLHICKAVHAEANALMQCTNINEIHAIYTTTSPCTLCMRLIMNTSCKEIYFHSAYDEKSIREWVVHGGKVHTI